MERDHHRMKWMVSEKTLQDIGPRAIFFNNNDLLGPLVTYKSHPLVLEEGRESTNGFLMCLGIYAKGRTQIQICPLQHLAATH